MCTLVGAFSGAMPVLIGYVAAAGRLDRPARLLFGILFLWQFPHFMSIAWIYREDYERAGQTAEDTVPFDVRRRVAWNVRIAGFGQLLMIFAEVGEIRAADLLATETRRQEIQSAVYVVPESPERVAQP